jgi:hypothetical protein
MDNHTGQKKIKRIFIHESEKRLKWMEMNAAVTIKLETKQSSHSRVPSLIVGIIVAWKKSPCLDQMMVEGSLLKAFEVLGRYELQLILSSNLASFIRHFAKLLIRDTCCVFRECMISKVSWNDGFQSNICNCITFKILLNSCALYGRDT